MLSHARQQFIVIALRRHIFLGILQIFIGARFIIKDHEAGKQRQDAFDDPGQFFFLRNEPFFLLGIAPDQIDHKKDKQRDQPHLQLHA